MILRIKSEMGLIGLVEYSLLTPQYTIPFHYLAVNPPSTTIVAPVTNVESSDARNNAV